MAAGTLAYLLRKLAYQIDVNAQFELNAALAIGLGLGFDRLGAWAGARAWTAVPLRLLALLLIALWLVRYTKPQPFLFLTDGQFRQAVRTNHDIAREEIARVAAMPGNIVCSYQTICFRAGKPFLYDEIYSDQALATGRLSEEQLHRALSNLSVQTARIDPRVSAGWVDPRFGFAFR